MAMKRDRFTSRPRAVVRFLAQRLILKPIVWSATKVTVVGKNNLKDLGRSFVVVANHASHLDAPLILGSLPRRHARFMLTCAAADYFFDVWWRRRLIALFFNAFPVDRTGASSRTVDVRVLLQRGVPLLLFPEGTRSKDGKTMGRFKPGAAALASAASVPCVPIAIIGTGIAHPRGSYWPGPGRLPVGVVFGEPMHAKPDETAPAFTARIRAEVEHLMAANQERILGAVATTTEGKAA